MERDDGGGGKGMGRCRLQEFGEEFGGKIPYSKAQSNMERRLGSYRDT